MIAAEGFFNFEYAPEGKQSLKDLSTVDALVRHFCSEAVAAYSAFHQEAQTREEALGTIEENAAALGHAFMGRDADYDVSEWHSTDRLGAHIRAQKAVSFKVAQDPGEAFFRWLGLQCITACNDLYNGTSPDSVRQQLEATVRGAVRFLMVGEG